MDIFWNHILQFILVKIPFCGLIYSKDGAQNITRSVFHNVLFENVEYLNVGCPDYMVLGQYEIIIFVI